VYDAAGRLVRTVLDETRAAGAQAVNWDGRNARGQAVGSGVYFYRLDAGNFSETRPLVRIR
jgi:flagellar hook assembly protein FlgD